MSNNNPQIFSTVLTFWSKKYNLSLSGTQNIKLDARTFNINQFAKKFEEEEKSMAQEVGRKEFYTLMEEIERDRNLKPDKVLGYMSDKVFGVIRGKLREESKKKATKVNDSALLNYAFDYSNHIPVQNVQNRETCMFNTKTKRLDTEVSFDAWEKWVNTRDSEMKKYLKQSVMPAYIVYNPYETENYYTKEIEGQAKEVLNINAHVMPLWRREGVPTDTPKEMPKMFKQLLEHLFQSEKDIEYTLNWIHYALTGRNQCILFLYGEKGTGKGTLVDIIERLVGTNNFSKIDPTFWESRFNQELKHKRVAFFDENIIDRDNVTRVRAMTNRTLVIEGKGVDSVSTENYCSFVWASNTDKTHYINFDDRRFSTPDITKVNICDALGDEWMDDLVHKIANDEEFIKEIGQYIWNHGASRKFDDKHPYKDTDTFYRLVEGGLSIWQKNVIELIESKAMDKYELTDIKELLRGTGRTTLAGFLENHRDFEGNHYGYVGQEAGGLRYIYADKKYWPEDIATEDNINFDELEF